MIGEWPSTVWVVPTINFWHFAFALVLTVVLASSTLFFRSARSDTLVWYRLIMVSVSVIAISTALIIGVGFDESYSRLGATGLIAELLKLAWTFFVYFCLNKLAEAVLPLKRFRTALSAAWSKEHSADQWRYRPPHHPLVLEEI